MELANLPSMPIKDILNINRIRGYRMLDKKPWWVGLAKERLTNNRERLQWMLDDDEIATRDIISDIYTIENSPIDEWIQLAAIKGYEIPIAKNLDVLSDEDLDVVLEIAEEEGYDDLINILHPPENK